MTHMDQNVGREFVPIIPALLREGELIERSKQWMTKYAIDPIRYHFRFVANPPEPGFVYWICTVIAIHNNSEVSISFDYRVHLDSAVVVPFKPQLD